MSHILSQFINYQYVSPEVHLHTVCLSSLSPCQSSAAIYNGTDNLQCFANMTITCLFTKYIFIEWLKLLDLIPLNIPSKESKTPLWGVTSFLRSEQWVKCFILAFNPETRCIMVIFICKSKFCSACEPYNINTASLIPKQFILWLCSISVVDRGSLNNLDHRPSTNLWPQDCLKLQALKFCNEIWKGNLRRQHSR